MTINQLKLELEKYDGESVVFVKTTDPDDNTWDNRANSVKVQPLPKLTMIKSAIVISGDF